MRNCGVKGRKIKGLDAGDFNRTAFIKTWLAQSVEHRATHLKFVGSRPIVGKNGGGISS